MLLLRHPVSNFVPLHNIRITKILYPSITPHPPVTPYLYCKIPVSYFFIITRLYSSTPLQPTVQSKRGFFSKITNIFSQNEIKKNKGLEIAMEGYTGDQLYLIGIDYYKGNKAKNIRIDQNLAIKLWTKARSKGSPHAAYCLANLKLEDNPLKGLLQDDSVDPIGTIQNLADIGFTQAMTDLAKYHVYGNHGIKKDVDKAIHLYEMAAKKGDLSQAPHCLYQLYHLKGEPEVALKWLKQAADMGDITAKFNFATMYNYGGPFIEQDVERATQLYRDAAEKKNVLAAHNFACACLTGRGIEVSPSLALHYFRIASDAGYLPSKMNLARIYIEGIIVPKDIETAKILYKEVIADKNEEYASIRENAKKFFLELQLNKMET